MKRLCLIRHAKSSWNHPSLEDLERPLDSHGEEDAHIMGEHLRELGIKPNSILTSNAVRALDTAKLIAKELGYAEDKIVVDAAIYDATVEDLLAIIQVMPADDETVVLVGHNPGLTWLANYLADDHLINLPTCGVYCVDFDSNEWADITQVEGKTLYVGSPKTHHE